MYITNSDFQLNNAIINIVFNEWSNYLVSYCQDINKYYVDTYLIDDFKKFQIKLIEKLKLQNITIDDKNLYEFLLINMFYNYSLVWGFYSDSVSVILDIITSTILNFIFLDISDISDNLLHNLYIMVNIVIIMYYIEEVLAKNSSEHILEYKKLRNNINNISKNFTANFSSIEEADKYDTHISEYVENCQAIINYLNDDELLITSEYFLKSLSETRTYQIKPLQYIIFSNIKNKLIIPKLDSITEKLLLLASKIVLLNYRLFDNLEYKNIINESNKSKSMIDIDITDNENLDIFKIVNVSQDFGDTTLFTDVNIEIPRIGWICFIGNSGCGKTTFCNLLLKKITVTKGEIYFMGRNNYEYDNVKKKISFIQQSCNLFLNKSIYYNITYGINDITSEIKNTIEYYMKLFKLDKYINNLDICVNQLSTGEKQRIKIITLIIYDKPIWLLDEITSNINEDLEEVVLTELKRIQVEKQKIVIHITHGTFNVKYSDYKMYIKDQKILMIENK